MHSAPAPPAVGTLRVAEVMTDRVVTIPAGATLRELVELLAATGVSGVPVVDGDAVVGVISARDLIEFESERPHRGDEEEGWESWDDPREESLLGAFFLDPEEEVGDVLDRFTAAHEGHRDVLGGEAVSDRMTRALASVDVGASLREAATRMISAGVHRLLVLDEGRLAGIVSATDIVRAVARHD
jgi:CBS domain-containing protein